MGRKDAAEAGGESRPSGARTHGPNKRRTQRHRDEEATLRKAERCDGLTQRPRRKPKKMVYAAGWWW